MADITMGEFAGLISLVVGTRYCGIGAESIDYGNGIRVMLQSHLGKYSYEFYRRDSKGRQPHQLIKILIEQREILFRKFEI